MSGLTDRWFHDELPHPDIDFQPWYKAALFARHSCFPASATIGVAAAFATDSRPLDSFYQIPRRFEWVAVSERLAIPATTFQDALVRVRDIDLAKANLYERDPQRFFMVHGLETPYTDISTVADSIAFFAERGFSDAIIGNGIARVAVGDIVMPLEKLPSKALSDGGRHRLIELGRSLGVGIPLWCPDDGALLAAAVDERPRNGTWPVYAYTGIDVLGMLADGAASHPTLASPSSQSSLDSFVEAWATLYGARHKGALSGADRTFVGVVSHGGHLNRELVSYVRGRRFQRDFGADLLSSYRLQLPSERQANDFGLVPVSHTAAPTR